VYLEEWHIGLIKKESEMVRKRYQAVARTLANDLVRITRKEAAGMIGRSKRQLQRMVRRFREEGIAGLRFRSKRPHNIPNKTPEDIEQRVVEVRKATGFGPEQLASIVNESLDVERRGEQCTISKTTAYSMLVRNGLVDAEKRILKECRFFEWGKPDDLIQVDITRFNGIPILTMEDDHSRKAWALRLEDEEDDTVIEAMKMLHEQRYRNLLTDNGSQFSRRNSAMKKYCEEYVSDKHIWTSVHHPQTMGKLSNFQRGLKRFLMHRMGLSTDPEAVDGCIAAYVHWYNNGKKVSTTRCYPEERYSGRRDHRWYARLVKALKLEHILPIPVETWG
jgi:transposase